MKKSKQADGTRIDMSRWYTILVLTGCLHYSISAMFSQGHTSRHSAPRVLYPTGVTSSHH
eukprot:5755174-Karenia_brevis.AAC.1